MSQSQEPPELTLSEIFVQHKEMWVAMLVTKRDENQQPIAGKIVAVDVDRYRLRLNIVKYDDVCIFFAGETPYPLLM
ncbi:MAG: hypothetical protein JRN20_11555 [Nitrososphaerota archaeon]|nr:hypothetical protein [Nitrososphaerota archaeon]